LCWWSGAQSAVARKSGQFFPQDTEAPGNWLGFSFCYGS
jgi:hypothetical protein